MGSYRKIMVGTDGSETSMRAVTKAASVAADSDAELLIVTACEAAGPAEAKAAAEAITHDTFSIVGSAAAESVLRGAASLAYAKGADNVDTLAVAGPPVEVLDKVAVDAGADLLVVGNVGLNTVSGRILGSVPQKVARRAGMDVLIVHTK